MYWKINDKILRISKASIESKNQNFKTKDNQKNENVQKWINCYESSLLLQQKEKKKSKVASNEQKIRIHTKGNINFKWYSRKTMRGRNEMEDYKYILNIKKKRDPPFIKPW